MIINTDKATLISPCSHGPGALEEAEALASSYGIRLNSNKPLWQVKVVLYRYFGATGICQYPLLKTTWQAVEVGWQQLSDRGCMGDEVCRPYMV